MKNKRNVEKNINSTKIEFISNTLDELKVISSNQQKLYELGVNLIDYNDGVNLLEKALTLLLTNNVENIPLIKGDIEWWLYENVNKIIYYNDAEPINVTTSIDFVNWVIKHYEIKL